MTVVLAGCGDLGTQVGLELIAAGRPVLGLRRAAHLLPAAFAGQSVDLAEEVPTLPPDTEAVVVATAADRRDDEAYRRAYETAVHHIVRAVKRSATAPHVLFVSSTGVYGVDDGSWVDERTPARPRSSTSTILHDAERRLQTDLPSTTVLRLAGLYGPGRDRLPRKVRDGEVSAADDRHWTNRIHRDDAAGALVHLLTTVRRPATLYVGADDRPAERGEVLRFLADEMGVTPPPGRTPTADPTGKRCRNARLRETGFSFRFPSYREGYRAILGHQGVRHP